MAMRQASWWAGMQQAGQRPRPAWRFSEKGERFRNACRKRAGAVGRQADAGVGRSQGIAIISHVSKTEAANRTGLGIHAALC
jgi:hypothetical protein